MNKLIARMLRAFADNIESGNTNTTEDELIEVCDWLAFVMNPESKVLGMSYKTFDYHVSKGDIPKGHEQQGFKEKFWYKRDIIKFKENLSNKNMTKSRLYVVY